MTDHPSALVSVPPHALEAIAFNLCSLHDFDPAFVQQNERFAKAAITEYLRATPAPAAPQAAGVGEPVETGSGPLYDLIHFLRPEFREETKQHLARRTSDLLRAPSREPEGGADIDALLKHRDDYIVSKGLWQDFVDTLPNKHLTAREEAPAEEVDAFLLWLEREIDDASLDIGATHQEGGTATEREKARPGILSDVRAEYIALRAHPQARSGEGQ